MHKTAVANKGGAIGNLGELPGYIDLPDLMKDDLQLIYDSLVEQNSDVKTIVWQLKRWLLKLRISASQATVFPYQTLVTSSTNLTGHTLNGVAKTKCKLTTKSTSTVEFDWVNCKRQNDSLVVVGIGDGVAEHAFLVNPDYNVKAFNVEYDGSGNLILAYRPGILIPVQGEPLQLVFVRFVEDVAHKGNIKLEPIDIAYGTTIYLHQRMPGE